MRQRLSYVLMLVGLAATTGLTGEPSPSWQLEMGARVSQAESASLREEVREMVRYPSASPLVATLRRHVHAVPFHVRQLHAPRLPEGRAEAAELLGHGVHCQPLTLRALHRLTARSCRFAGERRTRWAATHLRWLTLWTRSR